MSSPSSPARQERTARILNAAISVLAEQGARCLTHRRVDAAANLPQGTTSHYFPTSSALVTATITAIGEREATLMAPFAAIASFDDLIAAFRSLAAQMLGEHRELALARYTIFLETRGRRTLADNLENDAGSLVTFVTALFAAFGAPDPEPAARLAMAAFDGAVLQGLLTPMRPEHAEDIVEAAIRAGFSDA